MGVNASSQFLGAFFGGILGGQLLASSSTNVAWVILLALAVTWLVVSWFLESPRYLSTLTVELHTIQRDLPSWSSSVLDIDGVEEVVILENNGLAYVKIDQQNLDDNGRQKLSSLLNQVVAF